MRSLLLLLCFPMLAFGAAQQPLGPVQCDSNSTAVKLSEGQLAAAKQTEAALRNGSIEANLVNVDALNLLALAQYEWYRQSEASVTARTVADIWKREAPSAAIAARVQAHARQQLAYTSCKAAETLFDAALDIARKAVGEGDMLAVEIMSDLAVLYRVQRRLPERLALYKRIATALRADPTLGTRVPQVYIEMSDIAFRNKEYGEAEQHARMAIKHLDNGAEAPSLALAAALNEAAAALYGQGKLQEGDKLRDRAKNIVRVANGLGPVEVKVQQQPLDTVASLYKRGQVDAALAKALQELRASEAKEVALVTALTALQADPISQQVPIGEVRKRELASASRAIETQKYRTVYALADAADIHHSQERLAEAEPLYRKAFDMVADKSIKSPIAARLAHGLGIILRRKGELTEAERFQHIAHANAQAEMGAEHPDALEAQVELARLYAAQGKLPEATKLYTLLATREEQRSDADRTLLSEHLMPLAQLQLQQGDLAAAEPNFVKVAQLWRQGGTKNDRFLIASLEGLARLYAKQGKTADAKSIDAQLAALGRAK